MEVCGKGVYEMYKISVNWMESFSKQNSTFYSVN